MLKSATVSGKSRAHSAAAVWLDYGMPFGRSSKTILLLLGGGGVLLVMFLFNTSANPQVRLPHSSLSTESTTISSSSSVTRNMSLSPANCVIVPALTKHTATVIFAHGLGDSGHGWEPVAQMFAPNLPYVKWILPNAPVMPITVFERQSAPAWFDIRSWDLDAAKTKQDEEGLARSVERIESIISSEVDRGVDPSRIVVGGFSQGAAITAISLLRSSRSRAGYVILSGFMTVESALKESGANKNTPIFMGHGDKDDVVPYRSGQRLHTLLKENGFNSVDFHSYPGMPHSTCPSELRDLEAFIKKVLPSI